MHSNWSLLCGRSRVVPRCHPLAKWFSLSTSNSILLTVLLAIKTLAVLVTLLTWLVMRLLRLSVRLFGPRIPAIHVSLLKSRWVCIAMNHTINFVGVCSNLIGWAQVCLVHLVWDRTATAHAWCHASPIFAWSNLIIIWTSKDVDITSSTRRVVNFHWGVSANFTHIVLTCHGSWLILLLGLLVWILLIWWLLLIVAICIPVRGFILLLLHLVVLLLVSPIARSWRLSISTGSWLSIPQILSLILRCTSPSSLSSLQIIASIPAKTKVATSTYYTDTNMSEIDLNTHLVHDGPWHSSWHAPNSCTNPLV